MDLDINKNNLMQTKKAKESTRYMTCIKKNNISNNNNKLENILVLFLTFKHIY